MRFTMMVVTLSAFLALVTLCFAQAPYENLALKGVEQYSLPILQYSTSSLEPYIDEATINAHYKGHHYAYMTKTNALLKEWREKSPSELAASSLIDMMIHLEEIPQDYKTTFQKQGGGYVNHCFYWACMSPDPGEAPRRPTGKLLHDIEAGFQSYDNFQAQFSKAASVVFGSGYVWLVRDMATQELSIVSTAQQDCPLSHQQLPLICLDVWEHAYYLKHQYKRPDYIQDWWRVLDWENVSVLDQWWQTVGAGDNRARVEL